MGVSVGLAVRVAVGVGVGVSTDVIPHEQLAAQTPLVSCAHTLSQCVLQQNGSAAQMHAAHSALAQPVEPFAVQQSPGVGVGLGVGGGPCTVRL